MDTANDANKMAKVQEESKRPAGYTQTTGRGPVYKDRHENKECMGIDLGSQRSIVGVS